MCKHIAQNRFNSRIIPCYDMHTRQKIIKIIHLLNSEANFIITTLLSTHYL